MARALLLILVAVMLWLVAVDRAEAACTGKTCDTREEAVSGALAEMQSAISGPYASAGPHDSCGPFFNESAKVVDYAFEPERYTSTCGTATTYYRTRWYWTGAACAAGRVWDPLTGQCSVDCSAKESLITSFTPPNGSIGCSPDGCSIGHYYNGDGTSTQFPIGPTCSTDLDDQIQECQGMDGYYWHSSLNVCAPIDPDDCDDGVTSKEGVCRKPDECPAGMIEDANGLCKPESNECPSGQIKSPEGACLPGEGQCAAGEVRGDDGTCKKDADGDGEPDPDDPNDKNFSGGDTCAAPPSCSGDPIMCGQARIQWRIDCNTRRNVNIAGGSCDAVPICTGEKCDAMEYSQLLQQWRASCALQDLAANGEDNGNDGDADGDGQPDWTEADGMNQDPGSGSDPTDTDVWEERTIDGSSLDSSGWVGGFGSCPAIPSGGGSGIAADFLTEMPGQWCEYVAAIAAILLAFFTWAAIKILGMP